MPKFEYIDEIAEWDWARMERSPQMADLAWGAPSTASPIEDILNLKRLATIDYGIEPEPWPVVTMRLSNKTLQRRIWICPTD